MSLQSKSGGGGEMQAAESRPAVNPPRAHLSEAQHGPHRYGSRGHAPPPGRVGALDSTSGRVNGYGQLRGRIMIRLPLWSLETFTLFLVFSPLETVASQTEAPLC